MRKHSNALAKLRQFIKGMDVEEHLSTEMRQNLTTLERFINKNQVSSSEQSEDGDSATTFNPELLFSAIAGGQFTKDSPVVASVSNRSMVRGIYSGGVYFPQESGKYLVEFGCRFYASSPGTSTQYLRAYYSGAVVADTISKSVDDNTTPKYCNSVFYADLSPSKGIYFVSSGGATAISSNFFCKITRVP